MSNLDKNKQISNKAWRLNSLIADIINDHWCECSKDILNKINFEESHKGFFVIYNNDQLGINFYNFSSVEEIKDLVIESINEPYINNFLIVYKIINDNENFSLKQLNLKDIIKIEV